MFLAENIKYLREQAGMTQQELAEAVGLSSSATTKWELGMSEPELSRIVKLAELFKVTLDELVLQELKPPTQLYVSNIKFLREKNRMSQEYMANLLGYRGKQGYNAVENGKANISVENLEKISYIFGVTMDELVKTDLRKTL